jgi:hypothetical protein
MYHDSLEQLTPNSDIQKKESVQQLLTTPRSNLDKIGTNSNKTDSPAISVDVPEGTKGYKMSEDPNYPFTLIGEYAQYAVIGGVILLCMVGLFLFMYIIK